MKSVIKTLNQRHETISFVESMTGGALSYELVKHAGASTVYQEGFVTYNNDVKVKFGVEQNTIDVYGVVSKETAIAMVSALKVCSKADLCVSVTGNAGPTKSRLNDELCVYYAISYHDELEVFKHDFKDKNTRITNIKETVKIVKKEIIQTLEKSL